MVKNEVRAVLGMIRVSPRKLNLVAASIRGMKASKALTVLSFSCKRIAHDVRKTLQSAIANAENTYGLDVDKLYVEQAYVGKSLVLKRFHARAKGRGNRIDKPFSRLSIVVSEKEVG